ncbi:hypothetical protein DICPUDRAFT_154950 [Dictyostelium purpureum]|uniref:Uncharacterized protein n=1 Tax=Dictyostelium purpureum TaxID=5786 RepID=F0ZSP0_DICPU|nr:uncharacterized protein DICPUDRAFT_154950 [Dictyostelium purpureum]EGC33042.1 hypothetical protein DICPUDRAFT_154950 [Dictyostelium purpureum]|eukprot:XP_003290431.1 hypothetical protein DICPUDRAFT_154950 [Dictyostelium purpureum]
MDCNKKEKKDLENNNTNNNINNNNNNNNDSLKSYKSTDSSEFDCNNTPSNTPSLVFTSNKDTNSGETVFWKVFRNKFLFKLIFSNFKFKEFFSYDDLIDPYYIFDKFSNGDAIIRDKVKSGNYVFRDFNDVELVIRRFTKDTKENREFYRQLFSTNKYHNKNDNNNFSNYSFWVQVFTNETNKTAFLEYNKLFQIDKRNISVNLINEKRLKKKNLKLLKMKPFLESNGVTVTRSLSIYDAIKEFQYPYKCKELIKIYKEYEYVYNDYLYTIINSDCCIEYKKDLIEAVSHMDDIDKIYIEEAVFSSNNLELIDLMFKHFEDPCYDQEYQAMITKTEVLDYFFNNHQELMFSDNNPLWVYADKKVMGHFEELMKSISRKFFIELNPEDIEDTPINDIFERLERALNNPTLYTFESNEDYPTNSINRYKSYFFENFDYPTQDSAISMLEKHIEKYGISEYFDIEIILNKTELYNYCKFIYWIFQDLSDQYIQSNISNEELTIKSGINTTNNQKYEIKIKRFTSWEVLLFYCGRTNILYQNLNSNSQLMEHLFTYLNMNKKFRVSLFLNLFDHLSKTDLKTVFVREILLKAADNGLFPIFKNLLAKHEYLYYEQSDGLSIINIDHFRTLQLKCIVGELGFLSKYYRCG